MHVIGLTGGICSGKTTITKTLQDQIQYQPTYIVNADILGHQTYQKGTSAFHDLCSTFGEEQILNPETKEIDRGKLGAIVFGNPSEMSKLTGIVWPAIRELIIEKLKQYEEQEKASRKPILVILEAAVLFEAKWNDLCDSIWLIVVSEAEAVERLIKRNPTLSLESAKQRVAAQSITMSTEEKRSLSTRVLENGNELSGEQLEELVMQLLHEEISSVSR
jgi:dephospho-CoA kinase